MNKDRLKRKGFKPNPEKCAGEHRIAGAVTGRRARKEWPCDAEDCTLREIEWDEMYVEATDPSVYKGRHLVKPSKRYHMPCAIRHELIVKDEEVLPITNRRLAIAMTKAEMG